jgi:hypothetical protein
MGNLTPGANYAYENADGVIYARKYGDTKRVEVGRLYKAEDRDQEELWSKIRKTAKTNAALQQALDNVIILYYLGIDDGT